MKLTKVSILAAATLGIVQATTITFNNSFPDNHIIGPASTYAIQSIQVTTSSVGSVGTIVVKINTNYQNNTLSPFTVGGSSCTPSYNTVYGHSSGCLQVGDFFFSSAGTDQYGVALQTHGGVTDPGGTEVLDTKVYDVTVPSGVLTSTQVLGAVPGLTYNQNQIVWVKAGDGTDSSASVTPVVTPLSTVGNGSTTAEYSLVFTITTTTSDSLYTLANSGKFGIDFASADCANDYFIANSVPEPGTFFLIGIALTGAALGGKRLRTACQRLRKRSD